MGLVGLVDDCGLESAPGIETDVYIACECDVDESAWPELLPETAGTPTPVYVPGNAVTYDGNIVFMAGKFWKKFTVITDTGKLDVDSLGAVGSVSWKTTFDCKKSSGDGPALLDFVTRLPNACLIMAIREINGGIRIMGKPGRVARLVPGTKITSGDTAESERNAVMQFTARGFSPFYTGTLPTE